MKNTKLVSIPGSQRKPVDGARAIGRVSKDERFEVTVRVRRRKAIPAAMIDGRSAPHTRTYLTHKKLEAEYGADLKDIRKVEAFARKSGLVVVESSAARRSVILSGSAVAFSSAFGVKLQVWEHAGGTYRGRTGSVKVPSALADVITGVFGLDNRQYAKPHFRRLRDVASAAAFDGYAPPQVAKFYGFPTGVDGTGQVIGIIELGGGYRPADLKKYAAKIGSPLAKVTPVSVGAGRNSPTNANSADGEVMLDIEVAGSIAPGAEIVVYFAAGASDQDFLAAITQAVHDSENKPGVISISWGGPEAAAEASFQTEFDQALQSAAALGITVTIASGDSGAADEGPNEWDNLPHADFPASSPYALGCGATNIQVSGGAISSESVWNQNAADTQQDSFGSSGGGVSQFFAVPAYQAAAGVPDNPTTNKPGRGVPDVTGNGDPASGYLVRVDGELAVIGGTSSVAPLWAALITLVNQKLNTRVGFINPLIYAHPSALKDIVLGTNEVGTNKVGFAAGPGWDACSGLGSPNGLQVLAALGSPPATGTSPAAASRTKRRKPG
jgi:kumamolisin